MKYPFLALAAAPLLIASSFAHAQGNYPAQPIQVIVPYSPGGGDTVARLVTDRLAAQLGVTINVVNRPGAGGEIGIAEMADRTRRLHALVAGDVRAWDCSTSTLPPIQKRSTPISPRSIQ